MYQNKKVPTRNVLLYILRITVYIINNRNINTNDLYREFIIYDFYVLWVFFI